MVHAFLGDGAMMTGKSLRKTARVLAPVMILLLLMLYGVSSGAVLNPPRAPELSGTIPLPIDPANSRADDGA